MYITINDKRNQETVLSGYAGKNTAGAIEVDCSAPSEYYKLKADYQDFTGVEQWEVDTAKKQEVIAEIEKKIDAETDEKILTGFKYNGNSYYLSLENQINFKGLNDIRESLEFPVKVKHQTGYAEIANAADYHTFYLAGLAFKRLTIESGWAEKDALQNKTTAELIEQLNA